MNEYQEQAMKFLADTDATITSTFKKHGKHFSDDKTDRDIYSVTIARGTRSYTFDFGQSISNSIRYQDRQFKDRWFYCDGSAVKSGKDWTMKGLKEFTEPRPKTRKAPTEYDILACLTKYDPGTFEDFCADFGYDEDSRTAEKTYKAVRAEYEALARLFSDYELELMGEIQ